jgi:membrane glycosyltransferase
MLPRGPGRRRGDIATEWALAEAKLLEADNVEEAIQWLKPVERMTVMLDPVLIAKLMELPPKAGAPSAPDAILREAN